MKGLIMFAIFVYAVKVVKSALGWNQVFNKSDYAQQGRAMHDPFNFDD